MTDTGIFDREQVERRALEIAKVIEQQSRGVCAEIVPGAVAAWYVVIMHPGLEAEAIKHLSRRGFGIYDPMLETRNLVRGCARIVRSRLLPGYLLVFVWDIGNQWRRITDCPGVSGILCRAGTQEPAIVPDALVNYWQGYEISRCVAVIDAINEARVAVLRERAKERKARRYRNRKAFRDVAVMDTGDDHIGVLSISTKALLFTAQEAEDLAPDERIGLFHQAIGLGSKHLPSGI